MSEDQEVWNPTWEESGKKVLGETQGHPCIRYLDSSPEGSKPEDPALTEMPLGVFAMW